LIWLYQTLSIPITRGRTVILKDGVQWRECVRAFIVITLRLRTKRKWTESETLSLSVAHRIRFFRRCSHIHAQCHDVPSTLKSGIIVIMSSAAKESERHRHTIRIPSKWLWLTRDVYWWISAPKSLFNKGRFFYPVCACGRSGRTR
jgi:hypothetical protein